MTDPFERRLYQDYGRGQVLAHMELRQKYALVQAHFRQNILPHLPTGPETRILDLGCGIGLFLACLQQAGYRSLRGVDLSADSVRTARGQVGMACVEEKDAIEYLHQTEEIFDVVLVLDLLEHLTVENNVELLESVRRVLAPRGRLIITVPNALTLFSVFRYGDITHQRAYTPQSLAQVLRMSGFVTMSFHPVYDTGERLSGRWRGRLWKYLLQPGLKALIKILHGDTQGSVHTANLLAIIDA